MNPGPDDPPSSVCCCCVDTLAGTLRHRQVLKRDLPFPSGLSSDPFNF